MTAATLAGLVCLLPSLRAATSTTWETTGYAEYLKGRISGLTLSYDGVLKPGRQVAWETPLGQPALWSLAVGSDGTSYAATGHSGKVMRLNPAGKAETLWTADQAEVFAIAVDARGTLWAGSSPSGGLYRLEGSKAIEVWHSTEKYIWAIQPVGDGTLLVGTGEKGRIYRIDASGKASLVYETGQANVTALSLGPNQTIYAGTDPNGILYAIPPDGKASILYDSTLPEIRSIVTDGSGNVYAAAMGGALSTRTAAGIAPAGGGPSTTVTASTPTVITVTENAQSGARIPTGSSQAAAGQASAAAQTAAAGVTEVSGVERSAIYRISPDRTVETLRTSKEDNVYDLLWNGDSLVFSTDDHGRMYRWREGKTDLLADLDSGESTRIIATGNRWLIALSNPARVVSLAPDGSALPGKRGWYESPVHDANSVARWGHLQWRPRANGVRFTIRTGNSQRPDATWSAWSGAMDDPASALIDSPVARFIQWRAEWPEGSVGESLNSVSVAFLPQNGAPVVRSLTVSSVMGANAAKNAATTASSSAAYSITVTDSGEASAATSTTTGPSQTVSRLQSTQTQVTWQADDPDGDKLVYALYFRAEEAQEWQLIRSRMYENTLLLDPDVLADGRYYFRVVASDNPANAQAYAKTTDFVSPSVLVDNTPPVVSVLASRRDSTNGDIVIDALDQTSPLKRAEFSLDAGWWQPLEASDGVTDTPHEQFRVHLEKLRPGEHMVVVRVFDAAGNAGLTKILLR